MSYHARFLILSAIAWGGAACGHDDTASDPIELSAVNCSTATPWTVGTAYSVGALVTFGGSVYQCIQAHRAQSDWSPPVVPALWSLTSCGGGGGIDAGTRDAGGGGGIDAGGGGGIDAGGGGTAPGFILSPYKDTGINMDFNTNVISTLVPGAVGPHVGRERRPRAGHQRDLRIHGHREVEFHDPR